jgi:hypothetical protein
VCDVTNLCFPGGKKCEEGVFVQHFGLELFNLCQLGGAYTDGWVATQAHVRWSTHTALMMREPKLGTPARSKKVTLARGKQVTLARGNSTEGKGVPKRCGKRWWHVVVERGVAAQVGHQPASSPTSA